jgi:glucose/arabinose dehydrogenase
MRSTKGWTAAAVVLTLLGACRSAATTSTGSSASSVDVGAGLRGRAGLRATVYASGLSHVSAFAVDAGGRLWVATSDATDHRHDGIYLVRSEGAAPLEVVSHVRGPLGLAWNDGWLYVASIGRVDAFAGLKGSTFVRHRLVLMDPVAGAWNNGLVVGPNGRLVMSIATTCDHCTPSSRWPASIVSFRTDGSDLRRYARGVRDAFGLTFVPGTGRVLATMNQRDDLGVATPGDWLAVVRRGQDWGFPGCYGQGGAVCAGVPRPFAVLDAHAAAGGVAVVDAPLSGATGAAALVAEWSIGTVMRVELSASGHATPVPFLEGLEHPLPLLASDGGICVGDWGTGTVYRVTAG